MKPQALVLKSRTQNPEHPRPSPADASQGGRGPGHGGGGQDHVGSSTLTAEALNPSPAGIYQGGRGPWHGGGGVRESEGSATGPHTVNPENTTLSLLVQVKESEGLDMAEGSNVTEQLSQLDADEDDMLKVHTLALLCGNGQKARSA